MRLLIAGIAALAAVSFAAPSFAQDATAPAPAATPTPIAKPKPGTSAYCNSLKSSSQKSSCLKRIQTAKAGSHTGTSTKPKKPAPAAPATSDTSAQAPAAATSAPSASSVAVPPLPQKTI